MWVYDGVGIKVIFLAAIRAVRTIDRLRYACYGRSFAGMVDLMPFEST